MSQASSSAYHYVSLLIVSTDSRSSDSAPVWELQEAARWKHFWWAETPADSQLSASEWSTLACRGIVQGGGEALTSHQVHYRCLLTFHKPPILHRESTISAQAHAIVTQQFQQLQSVRRDIAGSFKPRPVFRFHLNLLAAPHKQLYQPGGHKRA